MPVIDMEALMPVHEQQIVDITARLGRVEHDLGSMREFIASSTDDIKDTIKGQLSDLKSEQIGDLKFRIAEMEKRQRETENSVLAWNTSRSVLSWIINTLILIGGAVAGYLGAKHL